MADTAALTRLTWPVVALLLAVTALAGCKSQGPDRAMARFYGDDRARAEAMAQGAAAGAPAARAAQAGPAGARAPGPSASGAGAPDNAPQTAARPDPAGTPPGGPAAIDRTLPKVDARPERFRDLSAAALDAELGRPALVRAEGPARVWQYRGASCVLDMVLYPGAQGRTVRHLEARDPRDARPLDPTACLRHLLQRHALAATG